MRVTAAVLAVLLMATVATAEPGIQNPETSVPDSLSIHLSQSQDSILSPLPVPQETEAVLGLGLATHSACAPLPLQTFTSGQHHTWYAVLSTADLDYKDDEPFAAAGQGLGADLVFDAAEPIRFTYYLITTGPATAGDAPMPIPRMVLEAQLREGDDISVDHRALDAGRLVARAVSDPATLTPALSGHPHVQHMAANGRHVYAFEMEMEWMGDPIVPQERGLNLRVDAYIDEPACLDGRMMPDWIHPYSGPGLRPGLDFVIQDPVHVLRLAPRVHNDTLLIEAEATSPWGILDLGPHTVNVTVEGPAHLLSGPTIARSGSRIMQEGDNRSADLRCYCHPTDRVELRQTFDLDGAADGTYTVHLSARNADGTAVASAETTFDLPGGGRTVCRTSGNASFCQQLDGAPEKQSPLASMAALGAAVAMGGVLHRRCSKP